RSKRDWSSDVCSSDLTMLEKADKQGFMTSADDAIDFSLLVAEKETDLLTKLGAFPQVVADAAKKYTPHHVTQYVFDLASLLHSRSEERRVGKELGTYG